jgi:hypothetical protein
MAEFKTHRMKRLISFSRANLGGHSALRSLSAGIRLPRTGFGYRWRGENPRAAEQIRGNCIAQFRTDQQSGNFYPDYSVVIESGAGANSGNQEKDGNRIWL